MSPLGVEDGSYSLLSLPDTTPAEGLEYLITAGGGGGSKSPFSVCRSGQGWSYNFYSMVIGRNVVFIE